MDSVTSALTSTLGKLHLLSEGKPFNPPSAGQISSLRQKYAEQAQEHVFTFWDSLSPSEQSQLYNQLITLDPARLTSISETVLSPRTDPKSPVGTEYEPLPEQSCASTLDAPPETLS